MLSCLDGTASRPPEYVPKTWQSRLKCSKMGRHPPRRDRRLQFELPWSHGNHAPLMTQQSRLKGLTWTGTPLEGQAPASPLDMVRCIATARITMPRSVVRLSAGRLSLSLTDQACCTLRA